MLKQDGAALVGTSALLCGCWALTIPFTGTLQVCCSWRDVEKSWLNFVPTWTDKQCSELFQEPSCPELENQVIGKLLQHRIFHSARLLSTKKNSPSKSSCGSTGKLEARTSPLCPNSQTSNPNKSREMGELCCFSPVCFWPQRVPGEVKISLRFPSLGRPEIFRWPEILFWAGICVKCLPARCQKMLLGTTTPMQVLRTICLALEFPGLCQRLGELKKPGLWREQAQQQQGARYQDVVLVIMVEQWVPQLSPDMCMCRWPLEISGCKLWEGVLFQVICFLL